MPSQGGHPKPLRFTGKSEKYQYMSRKSTKGTFKVLKNHQSVSVGEPFRR